MGICKWVAQVVKKVNKKLKSHFPHLRSVLGTKRDFASVIAKGRRRSECTFDDFDDKITIEGKKGQIRK